MFLGVPRCVGSIIIYIGGIYLRWKYIAYFGWIIPTLAFFSSFYCPESPVYLINQGNVDEASKAIGKINGNDTVATKGKFTIRKVFIMFGVFLYFRNP